MYIINNMQKYQEVLQTPQLSTMATKNIANGDQKHRQWITIVAIPMATTALFSRDTL